MLPHSDTANAAVAHEVGEPVRLSHHVLELDDGHQVGLTIGGRGVPLVFLHGLALNHRAYLDMLEDVAGMGFLVIAIDAAGHGDTDALRTRKACVADFAELTLRVIDYLGIQQAVFVGHSFGGRMVIELAASAPERVLAAVLFNAAAGAWFDQMLSDIAGPAPRTVAALLALLRGGSHDLTGFSLARAMHWARCLTSAVTGNFRHPMALVRAVRALLRSTDSAARLRMMRDYGIPTMVFHGDNDFIVPFETAYDVAEDSGGALYPLYGAGHSWMIADPHQGSAALRHLIGAELGYALRQAAEPLGIRDWRDADIWERALISPRALIRQLQGIQIVDDTPQQLGELRAAV
jgi:pimeloyl-ACP methyl ester carboxylesterase